MPYVAPIPIRADAIAAKIEAAGTYGTDSVPTAVANAVRISQRAWSSITPTFEWANLRDDVGNNSFIPIQAAAAHGMKAKLVIHWELKGLGSDYTSSAVFTDADPLIQACGWAGVYSVSPSHQWLYSMVGTSASRPSCSIYVWGGGNQYKVSGCRGNFEIVMRAGMIIEMTFTMEGILTALPVAAAVPTTTYTGGIPPAAVAQAVTVGPWSPDYDDITVRSNNRLSWMYSGNSPDGLQSYDFGLALPEIQVTARSTPQNVYEPITDWQGGVARAFTSTFGAVAFNKGQITDSGIWIPSEPVPENQKEFTGWRVTYRCLAPSLLLN